MRSRAKNTNTFKAHVVWDRTTRIFHWINVVCVIALAVLGLAILNSKAFGVSGDGKILLKTLHTFTGYVFVANLAWRIAWAFFGSRTARWRAILPFRKGFTSELGTYVKGIRTGTTPHYLGHNPLGRLMVSFLLLLLLSQAVTGLVLAGTDLYKPPFGGAIAEWVTAGDPDRLASLQPGSEEFVDPDAYASMRDARKPIAITHLYAFYLLMIAVFLHIAGVVTAEVREKSGLISAMISGQKVLEESSREQS